MWTRYVDPNSTGGDGTTTDLTGTNAAYASLNAAEAAVPGTVTEAMEIICCSNGVTHSADTTAVTFSGYTPTSSYPLNVYAHTNSRHAGVYNANKYRVEVNNNRALLVSVVYVTISWIQGKTTATTASNRHFLDLQANQDKADHILCYGTQRATGYGIFGEASTIYISNCVIYGCSGSGIQLAANAEIYNCTSVSNDYGINRTAGTCNVKNCYFGNNTTADVTGTITYTTCACEDNIDASGLTKNVAFSTSSGAYFTNVTGGSEDFSIGSSSALRDAGTDLGSTYQVDIAGTTRSGTWDIGAFEYVSTSTPLTSTSSDDNSASWSDSTPSLNLLGLLTIPAQASDLNSWSDGLTQLYNHFIAKSDTNSLTDAQAYLFPLGWAHSDTGILSDTYTSTLSYLLATDDTGVLSDALASLLVYLLSKDDTGNLNDSVDTFLEEILATLTQAVSSDLNAWQDVSSNYLFAALLTLTDDLNNWQDFVDKYSQSTLVEYALEDSLNNWLDLLKLLYPLSTSTADDAANLNDAVSTYLGILVLTPLYTYAYDSMMYSWSDAAVFRAIVQVMKSDALNISDNLQFSSTGSLSLSDLLVFIDTILAYRDPQLDESMDNWSDGLGILMAGNSELLLEDSLNNWSDSLTTLRSTAFLSYIRRYLNDVP